jgi:hypothetical protein
MPAALFVAGPLRPTWRSQAVEQELRLDLRDSRAQILDLSCERLRPRQTEVVWESKHSLGELVVLPEQFTLPVSQMDELRPECLRIGKPFDRHELIYRRIRPRS